MSRNCSVCSNAEATKIDALLGENRDSIRVIAQRYNLSPDALQRHKGCIQKKLQRVVATKEQADVTTYKSRVERALNRVEKWIEKLDETDDYRAQTAYTRELRGLLEQYGHATGELTNTPAVSINLGSQAAAPASPIEAFAHEPAADIAELLQSELLRELGPEKFGAVVALLAAQLPITVSGESVPGCSTDTQLRIIENRT
jgi:hypothetical protein